MGYMTEKIRKTLYLPDWVCEILDREGEAYDGPGVVAAAAITAFCEMQPDSKVEKLERYRSREIKAAYSAEAIVDDAEVDTSEKKRSRHHRPAKSG
jgi:hypothetical protein